MKRLLFGRAGAALAATLLMVPMLAACGEPAATPTATVMVAETKAPAVTEPTATTAMMEQATATTGSSTGTKLKVGLVTDVGSLNDKSFNESTWEGVLRAQEELGVEAKNIETKDTKDYAKNIEQFTSQGYDVIVTVGFALAEDTAKAAKANPVTSPGRRCRPELGHVGERSDDSRPSLGVPKHELQAVPRVRIDGHRDPW